LYIHDNLGDIFIAFFIKTVNNPPLIIIIEEGAFKFTIAHRHLAAFLGGFLQKTLVERHFDPLGNFEIIATDILNDIKNDDTDIQNLKMPKPWQLITIRNIPAPDNHPRQKKLLVLVKNSKVPTISFLYQNDLLVIAKTEMVEPFLKELLKFLEKRYYTLGVSLPFSHILSLRNGYFQCIAAIEESADQINRASDLAFRIILKQIKKTNQDYGFVHPALETLKSWDNQHNTELYETLYHYLQNERNTKTTSERLGIHRNTLAYRIEQIRDITGIDLDNPRERNFTLVSFWLDEKTTK
jgi:sugar diacid utilization regulator